MRTFVITAVAVLGLLMALESASDVNMVWAQSRIENQVLHFTYDYKAGPFVRRMSGTVQDPQGLWNALLPLQPPSGAHGAYGLIGDDELLGGEPGYGLRQLGAIARSYLTIDTFFFAQPRGWESIGVQSGTFTNPARLNDTTFGWAFFDLRPKFEEDLKKLLRIGE